MMPERRSTDGTAGYDPMILFVLPISPVLVLPVFVLFSTSTTSIHGNSNI